jgi:hypothetical protein
MEGSLASTTLAATASQIAASLGLSEGELSRQALASFVREKKRQVLQLRLDILARYGVESVAELESKIAEGAEVEHPAWEDLIVAENLGSRLEELDAYLHRLQSAAADRAA